MSTPNEPKYGDVRLSDGFIFTGYCTHRRKSGTKRYQVWRDPVKLLGTSYEPLLKRPIKNGYDDRPSVSHLPTAIHILTGMIVGLAIAVLIIHLKQAL